MIHELVLRVFRKVFPEAAYPNYLIRITIIAVPSLVIAATFAVIYKKIYRKIKNDNEKKRSLCSE